MTTITDSIFATGIRTQYSSQLASGSIFGGSSVTKSQTHSGVALQKLLTSLDKVEAALSGFYSASGSVATGADEGPLTQATSARIRSNEEINAGTPSHATANIVNPAGAFNGNDRNSPNFENGINVREGSFLVNGVEIVVDSDSSIYSILTSINASAADVTASYKSAEEKVVLTHNLLGASTAINLTNDSSGFLRATKLEGAAIEKGVDAEVVENTKLKPRSYRTANMLDDLSDNLASILEPSAPYQNTILKHEIQKIVDTIQTDFGTAQLKKSGLEFGNADGQLFLQNKSARRRLVHALQNGDRFTLNALTSNNDGKQGLIPSLKKLILEHISSANSGYSKGSITSLHA